MTVKSGGMNVDHITWVQNEPTGILATVDQEGKVYLTPVHFVIWEGDFFFHSKMSGQKMSNIRANRQVSFCVYRMRGIVPHPDGQPCRTNTNYDSVTLQGAAEIVNDPQLRDRILRKILEKYTPHLAGTEIAQQHAQRTAVVRIRPEQMTWKSK